MNYVLFIEYELVSINSCIIEISLLFDWMRLLFISFVLFISSIIMFYRNEYIEGDLYLDRFINLVLLLQYNLVIEKLYCFTNPLELGTCFADTHTADDAKVKHVSQVQEDL